jgi:hypothetical protein
MPPGSRSLARLLAGSLRNGSRDDDAAIAGSYRRRARGYGRKGADRG